MATSSHVAQVVVQAQTTGVSQSLKGVATSIGGVTTASNAANASNQQWGNTLDKIEKQMSGFSGSISKVTGLLSAGGLTGMIMGAASAFGEMTKRTLEITGANQALKISLDEAKKATMGLVDNQTLTLAANKATQLGVVKTDKEFANLAKTAAKLGLAMGQDAAKSVDDLTVALGRQSFEILDNLGIILKVSEANEIYAKRINKVASELTDAEKKQAFMTIGLERAQEAAERSNVSLDNQSAKLQRLSAAWTDTKDEVTSAFVNSSAEVFVGYEDGIIGITSLFQNFGDVIRLRTEEANEKIQKLKESTIQLTPVVQDAAKAASLWGAELVFGAEGLSKLSEFGNQQYVALVALTDKENERKNIMAEELDFAERQQKAIEGLNKEAEDFLDQQALASVTYGPELPPEKKKRRSGKKKEEKEILNIDRNSEAIATGEEASYTIQETRDSEAYTEQIDLEIQAREDKIQAIEFEMEYQSENADMQVELASKKYRAEQELLDFQIAAATTREEILDLELQKRKKTTQESQRIMLQAQKEEQKDIKKREAIYEKFAKVHEDLANVMVNAAWEAAEGQKGAMASALGDYLKGVSKQMAVKAAVELALGAAALAGVVSAGLAPGHFIAAGMAAAAAVAAGGAGVALSAVGSARADSGKDKNDDPTSVSTDPGMSSESKKGKSGSSSQGGGDEDGVPTSYYDGGLYSKKPDRSGGTAVAMKNSSITINASVLGATSDQVGIAIQRILNTGKRSLGNVK